MNSSFSTKLLNRSLIGALGLSTSAIAFLGVSESAKAANILRGSEYFISPAGESEFIFDTDKLNDQLNLGLPPGLEMSIPMSGSPGNVPGKGATDTIVKRLEDAVFDDDGDGILERTETTISIQMTELFLESVDSVLINGFNYDLFATLDPNQDTFGEMTITHNGIVGQPFDDTGESQGTFTSFLDVAYQVEFTPTNGGPAIDNFFDELRLISPPPTSLPTSWSHTPPPGVLLMRGQPGDGDANCHKESGPGCFLDDAFGDFFPIGDVEHDKNHTTRLTPVPEPSTIMMSILGLVTMLGFKKKKESNS